MTNTISKKELAQTLGYVFPSQRIDYKKLEKKVLESGLLIKLKIDMGTFKAKHKERFDVRQTAIIKKTFNITN